MGRGESEEVWRYGGIRVRGVCKVVVLSAVLDFGVMGG